MSKLTEKWDRLDDGTRTARQVADIMGCNISYVFHLRRRWWKRKTGEIGKEKPRCRRCDFFPSRKIPFIEEDLCLWCWLTENGIDHQEFYESGEWQKYVAWRPGDDISGEDLTERLREEVVNLKEQRGHSIEEAAEACGIHYKTWFNFISNRDYGTIGHVAAAGAARYIGIEPTPKGIAEYLGMHPRRVAMIVSGW